MWNKLVLTAGSDSQNATFKLKLSEIPISQYSESVEVVTDDVPSPDVRIGSGGATLNILRRILEDPEHRDDSKMLLVHSGGLSQRMPHLSPHGKVFGYLPNGKTILETKLEIYQSQLLEKLPSGGIMISASDVVEDMKSLEKIEDSNQDLVVFAHLSSKEVGTQHGVFIIDPTTRNLKIVLQKPSIEEMTTEGAIRSDGMVLTDSCYFMTWKFCRRLLTHPLLREPIKVELCCYGDFMRPMGECPKLDYIEKSPPELQKYRKVLAEVFKTAKVTICELGANSFFHFGTYNEFMEHLPMSSSFHGAFHGLYKSNVVRSTGFVNVPESSFVENSIGHETEVGENCVVSCVEFRSRVRIPDNTVIFKMLLKDNSTVTVMLDIREDIKKRWERVKWNGHDTGINDSSMWEAPIFVVNGSVERVLMEWENGFGEVSGVPISSGKGNYLRRVSSGYRLPTLSGSLLVGRVF